MALSVDTLAFAHAVSRLFGWIYVLSWSFSFYPQFLLNLRRRTTSGTTSDFPTCNALGFTCLTLSNCFLLFSPTVRREYAARHPLSPEPTVRANDVAFAIHGALICNVFWTQYIAPGLWGFERGQSRISWPFRVLCLGGIVVLVLLAGWAAFGGDDSGKGPWQWLDLVYAFGFLKLIVTLFKYMPQAYLNHKRRSTLGWSIHQILLDALGGVLSLAQLGIDSALQAATGEGGWKSGVTGNPVKFLLSNISLVFDVIFCLQHYVLFGPVQKGGTLEDGDGQENEVDDEEDGERRSLLPPARSDSSR